MKEEEEEKNKMWSVSRVVHVMWMCEYVSVVVRHKSVIHNNNYDDVGGFFAEQSEQQQKNLIHCYTKYKYNVVIVIIVIIIIEENR